MAEDVVGQLVSARKLLGLSQKQVAERMGVAQVTVCQFETGKYNPRLSTFQRYARALGGRLVITIEPDESGDS